MQFGPSRGELPRILGITPFENPDVRLAVALARAGIPGILDLGREPGLAARALADPALRAPLEIGVRFPDGIEIDGLELPEAVRLVVLPPGSDLGRWAGRIVLVQVVSVAEAIEAAEAGAAGVIAKGSEAGGRVGEETAFVLLQRLLATVDLPIWVQGGIGLHAAPGAIAGGAAGIVLDDQLALLREASTPPALREVLASLDGGETAVLGGFRVLARPDLPSARLTDASPTAVQARLGGVEFRDRLVPLGAAVALAAPLSRRFPTAVALINAMRTSIDEHLRLAAELRPLAPGGPLAASWGIRYPIAQGPMTRVSDAPAFAAAVAEAGGLPFLALSLLRAEPARELLRETEEALGGRPWGVGILGFVPPELLGEQLGILLEARPRAVLVAGGRPSQVRALEAAGVETWLHAPSPGLLDLYLQGGARHFVFEGRECGGHIGPHTSFTLWDAQIERLLAFADLHEVSALFAGGIHDARSAAMVSAMVAPLAAGGARVGVLMGTAYVFTEEAVTSGALGQLFQEEALSCERTVVLESAPGHAIRAAQGPFTGVFRAERDRLRAEGYSSTEISAALEALMLGRLRIATKGLRRMGDALVAVPPGEVRKEGLFMLGQVASLRRGVVSIGALHEEVSAAGSAMLEACRITQEADPPGDPSQVPPGDIAIVGMACVFPGASDLDEFWANVIDGVCAIEEVPESRWSTHIYFDPAAKGGGKSYSKVGGFLPDTRFDPLAYGIPPRSLAAVEPVQILALEVARRALADAGYDARLFPRARTSVIFGAEAGTELAAAYGFRALFPQYVGPLPQELDAVLPRLSEDSFPGVLANVISGRIANRLDLGGANYTVDAACASSLAALDLAVKELRAGTSDIVICGGADVHNSINDYLLFSSVHALSRQGECRVFDASADGTVIGEGIGALVLKRRADAERDGDRIYALIRGAGASSDGRSQALTAPSLEGQVLAVRRALEAAGVSPGEVGLVEAHGTGTVVGDRTELQALNEVFEGVAAGSCALGSVKSQVGHTKCAAGIAGVIKTALAVYHGVRPPTLGITSPNNAWNPATSPFSFDTSARPWPVEPRRAGVSAFGFGGTNFHAILEQPPGLQSEVTARGVWPSELLLFRGADVTEAVARIDRIEDLVARCHPASLRDLARSVCLNGTGPVQIAIQAHSLGDLGAKLAAARSRRPGTQGVFLRNEGLEDEPVIAFLFPGQGSQRPGMLRDLFVAFSPLHRYLRMGERWLDRMFPPGAFTEEARAAQRAAVMDTRVAQPTLGMADLAAAAILARFGVRPRMVAGHSYGELVALAVAGALEETELLDLSEDRGRCILEATGEDPGSMAAAAASGTAVSEALDELLRIHPELVLANLNSPAQTVLSGPTHAIRGAMDRLREAGIGTRLLPVACAFHSPLVANARLSFAERLRGVRVSPPQLPVWSNVTAAPYPQDPEAIRDQLAEHLVRPVRFVDQLEAMYAAGARIFVEVGPGTVLSTLVERTLADRPHLALPLDDGHSHGLVKLQAVLGALAVHGVEIDVDALFEGRCEAPFDLDGSRRPASRASEWLVNGHRARPASGDPPPGSLFPITEPVVSGIGGAPVPGADRDRIVIEYLSAVRQLVETGRDVMLTYLGGPGAPAISGPMEPKTAGAPESSVPPEEEGEASIQEILLGIVSERTGYPVEMLDLDLDLEADLSIDSIKRLEILGEFSQHFSSPTGAAGDRDAIIEELAGIRTLRAITTWLDSRAGEAGGQVEPAASGPEVSRGGAVPLPDLRRFVVRKAALAEMGANLSALAGRRVAISTDSPDLAHVLAERFRSHGAIPRLLSPEEVPAEGEDAIDLGALAPEPGYDPIGRLFRWSKILANAEDRMIVSLTAPGRGGAAGLLKTLVKERPSLRARVVEIDPSERPERVAEVVAAEFQAGDRVVEVIRTEGLRRMRVLEALPLRENGGGVTLDPDAVVLLTGGARGITAKVAWGIARRFGCRLELVGRTRLAGGDEDPLVMAARDRPSLRRALIERGGLTRPAEIETACDRILAERETRTTLATISGAGAKVRYHAVDVRDPIGFGALIDEMYARYGRLDGVIHGAGVLEDGLIVHKTLDSFTRVYETKTAGARILADKLRPGTRFVAFFGSVAGVFGNRGQADYAAANDTLDAMARTLQGRLAERVVSIDWGPWGGAGMVGPELEREYALRGIGLISLEEGVTAFLDEIVHGSARETQVVWMRATPEAME